MPFATTAAIVGATVAAGAASAGASIYGAKKQASAAQSAAELQHEDQQAALNFQEAQWQAQQDNQFPFIAAGTKAVNNLSNYANFVPPSYEEAQRDPGYQFAQKEGLDAINRAASATGNVFSGNTLRSAAEFNQGLASTQYNNVYNRALQTYGTNLNRLQSLAGEGQTAVGQLGSEGAAAAGNIGNINIASGRNIAQEFNNAAAAEASGYVGAANAVGGISNSLSQYAMLSKLLGSTNPTSGIDPFAIPSPGITPDYIPG